METDYPDKKNARLIRQLLSSNLKYFCCKWQKRNDKKIPFKFRWMHKSGRKIRQTSVTRGYVIVLKSLKFFGWFSVIKEGF